MNSNSATSLRDHFLIAMPNLDGGIFANSITYICDHSDEGAMGFIINHPLDIKLDDIMQHLEIDPEHNAKHDAVLAGGPVCIERGFVLHNATASVWESSIKVSDDIYLTSSQDILNAIARNEGPEHCLVALGYAGWSPGQLEEELAKNAWLTVPGDSQILFHTRAENRAQQAASQLGIDLNLISPDAGHA